MSKYKVPGFVGEYYTILTLDAMWEHVPKDDLDALEITGQGTFKFTFQKQFEAHYINQPLVIQDKEWAKITFITIWEDNRWIIEQIKNYKKKIAELSNVDSWYDLTIIRSGIKNINESSTGAATTSTIGTDTKSIDKGTDKSSVLNKNYSVANSGQSDSNSEGDNQENLEGTPLATGAEEELPENLMKIDILTNTVSQSKTFMGGKNDNNYERDNTTNVTNKSDTTVAGMTTAKVDFLQTAYTDNKFTNSAQDAIKYLGLKIPQFRNAFMKKFSVMFKA